MHAVSPNATHHGRVLEYDVHNLFGHQILNATYHALLALVPTRRPFIIGRSTFAGSGRWAGHWGGDNASRWAYMFFSIPQALSFSLFGIPMFGVDTCGFDGNADMELCARWMQLSAFFPFYRNHNVLGAAPQEPYVWGRGGRRLAHRPCYPLPPATLPIHPLRPRPHARRHRHARPGLGVPRRALLAAADRQFLLGPALLVTPVLEPGASTVDGVFPGQADGRTRWFDWYSQTPVAAVRSGQNVTIDAPLGHIPLFVRGGSVLPLQAAGMTTAACRRSSWASSSL